MLYVGLALALLAACGVVAALLYRARERRRRARARLRALLLEVPNGSPESVRAQLMARLSDVRDVQIHDVEPFHVCVTLTLSRMHIDIDTIKRVLRECLPAHVHADINLVVR